MEETKPIRVVNAKLGLESHERGIILVSQWMRDAGMEVIYLGPNNMVDDVIKTAVEEDADVIGLSFLGDTYEYFLSEMVKAMKNNGLNDVLLIIGGTIPPTEFQKLRDMGVSKIFPPGSTKEEICNHIMENVRKKRG